jgi:hypothetical protein
MPNPINYIKDSVLNYFFNKVASLLYFMGKNNNSVFLLDLRHILQARMQ